jgi:cytochrome c biogenesis protein CcmG, thiol:disulfide interchange protein DsbE
MEQHHTVNNRPEAALTQESEADDQNEHAYADHEGTLPSPAGPQSKKEDAAASSLRRREVVLGLGGVVGGLLIIAGIWILANRTMQPVRLTVAETDQPAPDFALPGLDGTTVRLSDYRGKVVLVNFWATWCEPCKEETPALQAAYQQLRDHGFVIIGVDLFDGERVQGRGEQDVRQFVAQYGVTYPIALDTTGHVARRYRVAPIPVSYLIDPAGTIRYIRVGQLTTADVVDLFRRVQISTGNTPAMDKQ